MLLGPKLGDIFVSCQMILKSRYNPFINPNIFLNFINRKSISFQNLLNEIKEIIT